MCKNKKSSTASFQWFAYLLITILSTVVYLIVLLLSRDAMCSAAIEMSKILMNAQNSSTVLLNVNFVWLYDKLHTYSDCMHHKLNIANLKWQT